MILFTGGSKSIAMTPNGNEFSLNGDFAKPSVATKLSLKRIEVRLADDSELRSSTSLNNTKEYSRKKEIIVPDSNKNRIYKIKNEDGIFQDSKTPSDDSEVDFDYTSDPYLEDFEIEKLKIKTIIEDFKPIK